ncbi:Kinesin-like protein [Wickerhamomyces ciferrii]|uniref:Kinesin-like protein KIP1 n=1 Tax=Wickerhamomyces ciferrii (strain ATCC 14091 / BCRC 22168 / CBS 111 / JCM 3599 / NBRC 0793 / NRRL Y-1031 F-60-10) TaxID=1206466 RepID=K0KVN2_WICCF|nr:Kinesin-like protein [Wickerhamomyces ciferrii]CCH45198.1 Kinesin-like protein [Wickerhamomyces ciferrii]
MSDRNSIRPGMRTSLAPARSRASDVSKKRSSIAHPPNSSSGSFTKPKQSTTSKRKSDVDGKEESHISVYVRCRSRNDREIKENSGVVVSTMGHMGKEIVLQTGPMSVSNKTYTFDRVFGAESDQEMVYDGIASGVLEEMLQGYNCTVFAYGQTGTGKTYTMSGDIEMSGTQLSENAGIIPRTLTQLFNHLEKNPDFSVKISFIELYNEELRDLLNNETNSDRKVRIFEEPNKKSIMVQGMEEIYVKSAVEGMKVLADGSYKRQVAATQCNDLSSRSHTVFTITVHMKEVDPVSGEEYLKIGKLNLVDLAGSENINRSGAENKRAREAGMINQSLLTLGRVINALVDQSPHIPYRESKLTRLLQDSLGGRTKTCIIATISPAKVSLEETISTLEYANRAKNIKNKPQVNSSMSKKMLIKEYVQEIERLRNDLNATRSKNGIYVTEENWQKVTAESESRRIQVDEQKLRMDVLEEQIKKFKTNFEAQLEQINKAERDLEDSKQQNEQLNKSLIDTTEKLNKSEEQHRFETFVSEEYRTTENELHKIGVSLTGLLEDVIQEKEMLYSRVDHKSKLEKQNVETLDVEKEELVKKSEGVNLVISQFHKDSTKLSNILTDNFEKMVHSQQSKIKSKRQDIEQVKSNFVINVDELIRSIVDKSSLTTKEIDQIEHVKQEIKSQIISELDEFKLENSKSSQSLLSDLSAFEKLVSLCFEKINQQVKTSFETVQTQLEVQSAEIIDLKNKLLEHQTKYVDMIKHQTIKLENFKESERKKSKFEKQQLLEKITSLIDSYDEDRNKRVEDELDHIKPELEHIASKQTDFTYNFDKFISENWLQNQTKFQEHLNEQKTQFSNSLEGYNGDLQNNTRTIMSNIETNKQSQESKVEYTISNLDSNMDSLNNHAQKLKEINGQSLEFSTSQLNNFQRTITDSFASISKEFKTIGKELENTKPQLVDNYLSKQNSFFDQLQTKTQESIQSLQKHISSIRYSVDEEEPMVKRPKFEIHKDLPKSLSRDEIEELHREEIYGEIPIQRTKTNESSHSDQLMIDADQEEKKSIASPLMPIPDKPYKQPLATSTRDLNIIRKNSNEANEKLKRTNSLTRKETSRPGSAHSNRSN